MIAKESPLRGMSTGAVATVAIRELPGLHSIDLRVQPGSPAQSAVAAALGIHLPSKPGKMATSSVIGGREVQAMCLAPDWWLIAGFAGAQEKLVPLKDSNHFSSVDVSGQRTTIELEGHHVREVLTHLWEQDLREKSFPVGSVSQGLMAKAPVIVCHVAALHYRVMVRSSFALHLWQALVDAAEERLFPS